MGIENFLKDNKHSRTKVSNNKKTKKLQMNRKIPIMSN